MGFILGFRVVFKVLLMSIFRINKRAQFYFSENVFLYSYIQMLYFYTFSVNYYTVVYDFLTAVLPTLS